MTLEPRGTVSPKDVCFFTLEGAPDFSQFLVMDEIPGSVTSRNQYLVFRNPKSDPITRASKTCLEMSTGGFYGEAHCTNVNDLITGVPRLLHQHLMRMPKTCKLLELESECV